MKKRSFAAVALSFFISMLMLGSAIGVPALTLAATSATATVSPGTNSAAVSGTITGYTAADSITFDYDLSSSSSTTYPNEITLTPNSSGAFTATISPLNPGTYSYNIYSGTTKLLANTGTFTISAAGGGNTGGNTGTGGSSSDISIQFQLKNPLGATGDLNTFLQNILKAMVLLLTPVVVIMVLYSGFLFVSARGNVEKLGDAKKALLYTLIGAAIVLGAQGFATILKNTVTCLAGAAGC